MKCFRDVRHLLKDSRLDHFSGNPKYDPDLGLIPQKKSAAEIASERMYF